MLALLVGLLSGYGWLYVLRGLGAFSLGPGVGDSLPLLQLARFDTQPLARVIVAWLLAGILIGLVLFRVSPRRRALLSGVLGAILLLLASQAADALARNLRFSAVLTARAPGPGPWLEAVVLALGAYLPRGLIARRQRPRSRPFAPGQSGLGHGGLGLGQERHAPEHDGDRDHVGDYRDGIGAQ